MGKLTSLVAGAGQGYLAAGRYQDAKDRNKTQDAMLKEVLIGRGKSGESGGLELLSGGGDEVVPLNSLAPLSEEEKARRDKEYSPGMANGGMVQPMPVHHDNMSWQRQSFKK
jgi:hypothetical protein